jgi:hypothetical protein
MVKYVLTFSSLGRSFILLLPQEILKVISFSILSARNNNILHPVFRVNTLVRIKSSRFLVLQKARQILSTEKMSCVTGRSGLFT